MTGCLKVLRCPIKCIKDVSWDKHFSICIIILRCYHPYVLDSYWVQNKGIRSYVLWDIADRHNAIIMYCSCSNLGICVWDTRHTVKHRYLQLAHQQRLSSLLSQLLATSPECLAHGYLSKCWLAHLWRESDQWVVKSATGMALFTMT